jgi:outer membrane receptor protein involved in Fe transport
MKNKLILMLTLMTIAILPAATLSGLIKDIKTNKALAFANIAVYEKDTETIKTGTMSGVDGTFRVFNVPAGNYYLVVTYMGYEQKQFDGVSLDGKNVDIGTILLTPTAIKMDNVTVEAEKPAITYKIDKQVIDARQFITASGGTAVDILENVPSVQVDIEGKVSLRNSYNFTVMIDGRPSVLEPQDALKTIPAETIENIEIMTNPSAKFESEGGAGIINIVTQRDKRIGLTGLASLRAGTNGLSGSALLSYRNKKISSYVSFDYRVGSVSGESFQDRYLYFPDTTANYRSEGIRDRSSNGGGVKGGLDWTISKNDVVGFSANYGPRTSTNSYIKDYTVSFSDPVTGTVFNTHDYINYQNSSSDGMRFNVVADYTHTFPEKKEENVTGSKDQVSGASSGGSKSHSSTKHQIKFAASYSDRNTDRESFTYLVDTFADTTEGQWTTKINPSRSFRGKFEYKRPINNTSHFETGANANFNWKSDGNNVYQYVPLTGDLDLQDQFSNLTAYKQNTLSAFALYSAEFGQLGFQPGIRAEYTYREINSDAIDSLHVIDSLHIFPSLHLSYQLPSNIQLMGSYSRRISRPPGWQLQPFYTWQDAYNIRIGNPALRPQMIDSYGLRVQKSFGKSFLSLNAFYSYTNDKIERIQTVYQEGEDVILSTYKNVGKDQSLGLSAMSNLNLFSWWRMNISGSLYYYQIEGELYGEDISKGSVSYSARIQNTFMFPTKTRIQLSVFYLSKFVTAQGSSSGLFMTNLSLRQDFFKRKLSATLQVSDIFGTGFRQSETYTPTTYIYSEYYYDAPKISLNLSLKINNYKKQRSLNSVSGDGFNAEDTSEY